MRTDVLVVGGGGREHALVSGVKRSAGIGRVFCAPGNAGIGRDATLVPIQADDLKGLADFAEREDIGLTVVGPEAPLVAGIADVFRGRGLTVFGPSCDGALLEGSKAFAKEVMACAGIPTAGAAAFTDYRSARAYLEESGAPVVVKADGLAAGKGVTVALTIDQADAALRECLLDRRFGDAGRTVLLEEYLMGEELSLLAIVSDDWVLPLAAAQDYKRIFDGDKGPNTGGMGCYSPVPSVRPHLYDEIADLAIRRTIEELTRRGTSFRGVLYAGVILTQSGPKVLEFNCRFGDPETQVLIPRLRSDLLEILLAAARGEELPAAAEWMPGPCVGVVMASGGYPASSSSGDVIQGVEAASALEGVEVFHSGTARNQEGELVTAGGRVLTVSAVGASFAEARKRAYSGVGLISFDGAQNRTDIGHRAQTAEEIRS
ncbi:MAG: phosphoribosylamine--glycine ligase [Actinobacteria bacterium]|nr:phosphoribosylamine--glycine ligase [Actinomycetota bacterium]